MKKLTNALGLVKTIAIIVLIGLVVYTFIQRRIDRNKIIEQATENAVLDTEIYLLSKDKNDLKSTNIFLRGRVVYYKEALKASQEARNTLNFQLNAVRVERDSLKEEAIKQPVNTLYQYLLKEYNFPGVLKFPFNGLQVQSLYVTHEDKKLLEEENEILYDDISECNLQLDLKDSIIHAQVESMTNHEKIDSLNNEIIENYIVLDDQNEEEIKRLKRQNIIGKIVIVVEAVAIVLVAI